MKAINHRTQHLTGSSVGFADYETPIPPQVCCPLIGGNTIPLQSCQLRQTSPDHPRCRVDAQGNCLAKRDKKEIPVPTTQATRKKLREKAHSRVEAAKDRSTAILALYAQGLRPSQIASLIGCVRETVYLHLRANGIRQDKSVILRGQIIAWLHDNPDATTRQIVDRFSCPLSIASSYRGDFLRARARNKQH